VATLRWTIASGSGDTNVHFTFAKEELPDLAADPASVIAVAPATVRTTTRSRLPTGTVGHYRVFGRASCSGASVP